MKLVKAFLLLNVVMWLPYGIACLVNPSILAGFTGISMTTATAVTEIRAMYGGMQSAIGLICLFGLISTKMVRPALAMVAFAFCGIAIARVMGLAIDSSGSEYTYGAVGFEIVGAIISVIIFIKQPLETA